MIIDCVIPIIEHENSKSTMHPIFISLLCRHLKTVQLDSQLVLMEAYSLPHPPLLADVLKQREHLPTIYSLIWHRRINTSLLVY